MRRVEDTYWWYKVLRSAVATDFFAPDWYGMTVGKRLMDGDVIRRKAGAPTVHRLERGRDCGDGLSAATVGRRWRLFRAFYIVIEPARHRVAEPFDFNAGFAHHQSAA